MTQKILLAFVGVLIASCAWATEYTLTLYADGCSEPNTFICSSGQQLSVNASPMKNRNFVKWDDGNIDNPRIVTMDRDRTYTAFFAPDSLSISQTANFLSTSIPTKVVRSGQVLILRGDRLYDLRGQEVK